MHGHRANFFTGALEFLRDILTLEVNTFYMVLYKLNPRFKEKIMQLRFNMFLAYLC